MPEPFSSVRYTQMFDVLPSTAQIAGPAQSDGKPLPYCRGFHVITAGNVNAILKDDQANGPQQFAVLAGVTYHYALAFFLPTTSGVQAVIKGLV